MTRARLAIVVSHPIQHFVHLYRALSARDDLVIKVFYGSRMGLAAYHDKEMAAVIKWAGDMTSGYDHEFLPGAERTERGGFFSMYNRGVGAAVAAFNPDAVMLYGYAQANQLAMLAWCRWHGVPALMAGDGDNVDRRGALKARIRALVLHWLLRRVSGFLTVGDQNEAMLSSLGAPRERMYRVPFPIDEATYLAFAARRDAERARVRLKHGIAENAFVFLFVGKLSARKRPADIVEAWSRMPPAREGDTPMHLLFCGDGPDRAAVAAAIERARAPATLAGFVNVDELPAYYCAADVLVHPSEHDPHPLICSEAACIGLPMILSDHVGAVGPTDIARAGVNALVFRRGDADELAAAMAKLAADDALFRKMSSASTAIYAQCDMRASAGGVARAVASVIGQSSGQLKNGAPPASDNKPESGADR
jgi:glycosyltransferase involved in cell wall biosynthesis